MSPAIRLRGIGRAFFMVAAIGWIGFASLILVLRYALLPHIDHYRDDLERVASRASGENVRIGAVTASWQGLRPSIALRDVAVTDPTGGQTLVLPSIRATLSWQTLVWMQLRLASLEVDAPQLTVRRDPAGQLYVAGFPIRKKASPDNKAAEWLLAQDEVRIHGAQLIWRDEMEGTGAVRARPRRDLVLSDITLALVKSGSTHHAALRASPPAALAAPLDLRAVIDRPVFSMHGADPAEWSGELYANVATGDIVVWREWLPLPATIDAGHGRARVWMTFAKADAPAGSFARRLAERIKRPLPAALDRIATVTADLALDDVAVRWGAMADAPEYSALGAIDGRVVGSQSMTEQRLVATRMALQPRLGPKVVPTDFELRRKVGSTVDDESGEATLGAIDIAASLALVPEPLIPPAIGAKLTALKPRGALERVAVKWTGPLATPTTFEGEIRFSRLALAPQAPTPEAIAAAAREIVGANGLVRRPRPAFGQPGFENLSGTLTATRAIVTADRPALTQATIVVASSDAVVNAPGLFDEPVVRFAHLAANIGVRVDGGDVEVKVDHASLDNPDLAGTIDLTFRHGPNSGGIGDAGGRGWLDLDARLSRADVARVPRYLPNIIGERTRVYLKRSLISGKVSEATLRLRGPLEYLNLREQPGALMTANPVNVQNALVAVRDRAGAAVPAKPTADDGSAKSTGPGDTIFHAVVKVHDATYLFGPGRRPGDPPPLSGIPPSPTAFIPWPAFDEVDADIVIDRARMTVHARSARVYDYRLTDVTAELPALADPAHVLRVTGRGTGPMQDLVRFINNSPISRWTRRVTDTTQATRNASLALALDLPLTHPRDTEMAGSLKFDHNDVALNALVPPIRDLDGRMDFTDRGLTIEDLSARVLGGPLRVDASTGHDGFIAVNAKGTIDVAALQASAHENEADGSPKSIANAVDRAARYLSGRTDYAIAFHVRSKRVTDLADNAGASPPPAGPPQPDLVVRSDLAGLAIALPAPFGKTAAESRPLRVELTRTPANASTPADWEDLRVAFGDDIEADITRLRDAQDAMAVSRAGYRVGRGTLAREGPSEVTVDLPSIDVDAWRAVLKDAMPPRQSAAEKPAASGSLDKLLPARAHLKTDSLRAYSRDFTHVDVTAERLAAGWQADVVADQVAGRLSYTDVSGHVETRAGVAPPSTGRLVARLERVVIPPSDAAAVHVERSTDASRLTDFPSIDVVVDRFDLRGRTLGRLEVVAENVDAASGREWRLEKLGLTMPEARFQASGVWGHGADTDRTRLDFDIRATDVGALMDRFGMTRTIRSGTAHLSGRAAWDGGPSTIDFSSMSGALKLEADKGQFLKAEPGVAKLLNILSLQGLARRLTLDFTDVFSPGFAFDTVRANATVDRGIATTDDFTMRGVQATVRMSGSADLEHETTKLHVIVEPQINAGAASLGVAVINPVVGLATFAAQYLFKDSITRALTFEYNVEGPWAKPDVSKIDRNGKVTHVVPKTTAAAREPAGASGTPQ